MDYEILGDGEEREREKSEELFAKKVITTTTKKCIFMDGGEGGMGIEEKREIIGTWN